MADDIDRHVTVRYLGLCSYMPVWEAMKRFTDTRNDDTVDEIWVLQHAPVFTLGQAGKEHHLLAPGDIPVIKTDRGGQVTYHGPGQLVVYLLINLRRRRMGVRQLVTDIEHSLLELLAELGVEGSTRERAPGVYVQGRKIASLGLRIRKGFSFHGLSLNVAMDLAPFSRINVCGYEGLEVTQISDLVSSVNEVQVAELLIEHLRKQLAYTSHNVITGWNKVDHG